MSVINKMLQDLENREKTPLQNNQYVAPELSSHGHKMWLLIALVVVLTGVAIALFYLNWRPGNQQKDVISQQPVTVSTQSPVTKAATPQMEEKTSELKPVELPEEALTDNSPVSLHSETLTSSENTQQNDPASSLAVVANSVDDSDLLTTSTGPDTSIQKPATIAPSEPKTGAEPLGAETLTEGNETPRMTVIKSSDAVEKVSLQTRIEQAIQQGDTMQSITLLQQLAEQEPDDMSVMKKLASQQFAAGQITQAMATLDQARIQFPNAPSLLLMLSRLYQHQGEDTLAWETIAKAGGTDTELLSYRATLASSLMNHEAARQDYRQLLQIEPTQARWWLGLAVANDKLSYAHDALLAYRRVLQHGGVNSNVEAFVSNRIAVLAEGAQ